MKTPVPTKEKGGHTGVIGSREAWERTSSPRFAYILTIRIVEVLLTIC